MRGEPNQTMPPSLSITNILQALYTDSPTIKMYVDAIAAGRPVPYTILTKSTEAEQNEKIVAKVRERLSEIQGVGRKDYLEEELQEFLDEAMILEEEEYTVIMFKGDDVVEGSTQIVTGTKIETLKEYAKFKGFRISIKKR